MEKLYRPLARTEDLIVEELQDEVLLYDRRSDKVHCLNSAAASVWRLCDGKRTIAEMAKRLPSEGLKSPTDEQVVLITLDRLSRLGLLVEPYKGRAAVPVMTRRRMIRNLGLSAAAAVPLIMSMAAPTTAQGAYGCIGLGGACSTSSGSRCCPGLTCTNIGVLTVCS